MYYDDEDEDMVVFIVKRHPLNPLQGGNVYVHPSVTNIVGTFIIDGAMINYDGNGVLNVYNVDGSENTANKNMLRRQLVIFGSLMSANSVAGALGDSGAWTCPYGTDAEKLDVDCSTSLHWAQKYDLSSMRYVRLNYNDLLDSSGEIPTGADATCHESTTGVRTLIPQAHGGAGYLELEYAWAGKTRCEQTDSVPLVGPPPSRQMRTTDHKHPIVIEFNPRILSADLDIINLIQE